MGMKIRNYPSNLTLKEWLPSEAGADLHKWKKKLRAAFGVKDIGNVRQPVARAAVPAANPAMIPLLDTPARAREDTRDFGDNVFSKGEESPYFQDSHMVRPRSASRARRLSTYSEGPYANRGAPRSSGGARGRRSVNHRSEDSSDSDYDCWGQVDEAPRKELARQMEALCPAGTTDSGSRIELATHIPLDRIKRFSGRRNKGTNSINWLKTFVFEMNGTRTRPDEWCVAFELSLLDGAIHRFRPPPPPPTATSPTPSHH
ncbi:hypothetical protein PI125_g26318 [Phytophthora idaei]|nr:hypothetical protein PI125_g26318 [Phytophthora idaei]